MKARFVGLAVVGAALLVGGSASAADFDMANATVTTTEAVPPGGGWTIGITPYAWLTGINGTITASGRSVSTSASFIDLVENSDKLIPFMGAVEIGKDRFSLFGDVFYSDIGFSGEKTKQLNPVANLEISLKGKVSVDTTLTIIQAAAAYDIIKQGGTALAVYGGARYWHMDADLALKVTGKVDLPRLGLKREGKYAIARSGGTEWVDPVVGMRVRQQLTPHDNIQLAADIGGFGVGSQFSWQVFGGYNHTWDIGKSTQLAASLGYRILSVDYEEGSGTSAKALDLTLHGPLAGLTLRW